MPRRPCYIRIARDAALERLALRTHHTPPRPILNRTHHTTESKQHRRHHPPPLCYVYIYTSVVCVTTAHASMPVCACMCACMCICAGQRLSPPPESSDEGAQPDTSRGRGTHSLHGRIRPAIPPPTAGTTVAVARASSSPHKAPDALPSTPHTQLSHPDPHTVARIVCDGSSS